MKHVFIIYCISLSVYLSGQDVFYVQDPAYDDVYGSYASDLNLGTDIARPWATWQRAFNIARAGDTVYFRGGTWYPPTKSSVGYAVTRIDPDLGYGNNGTPENPICFFAYPPDFAEGNYPILDCTYASEPGTGNNGIGIANATYIKFKGLTVRNVRMLDPSHNCVGVSGGRLGTVHFEQMTVHNVGGAGMWAREYDTVYFINCDVYNCCDSLDVSWPGGDGDGIMASSRGDENDTTYLTVLRGCRVWNVSDDGYDIGSTKQIQIDSCWTFNNGNYGEYSGDGTGFKFSYSRVLTDGKRWTRNCISARNRATGFAELNLYSEDYGPRMYYFNNSSYGDGQGFGAGPNYFDCGVDPAHDVYRNNIIFAQRSDYQCAFSACNYEYPLYITQDHNTWIQGPYHRSADNPDYNVTEGDFESLDMDQLLRPRKPNGSLPDITFMRPVTGSDLIDRGIDVGLLYSGSARDLGAHELGSVSISLIAPVNGSEYEEGDQIVMQAETADESGFVNSVSFYLDGELFLGNGEMISQSVWKFVWDSDVTGDHSLRSEAVDRSGMSTFSNVIEISINASDPPDPPDTTYNDFEIYPNPNSGEFTLELEKALEESSNINVMGMDGRIHDSSNTINEGEKTKLMTFQAFLSPGVYVLWFVNQRVQKTFNKPLRFIVQ
ncbi:MAG: right-handed parallel beta-helix repeat-containing protein [Bacteroidales bacterium]|nr:right-handed parallel beta-helix repeat-containing protein [Bacteroidales bacterium]